LKRSIHFKNESRRILLLGRGEKGFPKKGGFSITIDEEMGMVNLLL